MPPFTFHFQQMPFIDRGVNAILKKEGMVSYVECKRKNL